MRRYDVIVVGGGPGGLAAAASAAEAGGTVLLIELLGTLGGNASQSTGYLALIGTELQRKHQVSDCVADFMADGERQIRLELENGPMIWDRELTELYARESAATYDELTAMGVRFSRLLAKPSQHCNDRIHALEDPAQLGTAYAARLETLGVEVVYNTDVTRLITTEGRATGVAFETRGAGGTARTGRAGAQRGVILATGGYQGSYELRRRHQKAEEINDYLSGVRSCRGMGHVLGAAMGGDLINMDYIQPMIVIPSLLAEDAIAVNRAGKRFHDETGKYADRVKGLAAQPGGIGHYIIDTATFRAKSALVATMPEPPIEAPTLDALAEAIDCDPAALRTTVETWNGFLAGKAQTDPATGRTILPKGRRPLRDAPFYALRMVRATTFTWGGFAVTRDMQVVDVMGAPVGGLFAVGDTTGGINVISGMGGIHIASALVQGRLAGRAAMAGPSASPHLTAPALSRQLGTKTLPKMVLFDLSAPKPDR